MVSKLLRSRPTALIVRVCAGTLLVVASLLKGASLGASDWLHPLGAIRLVEAGAYLAFEMSLGLFLLLNVKPCLVRRAAAACFACFFAYSLILFWESASSCGCFGRIPVSPRILSPVDALLAILLFVTADIFPKINETKWLHARVLASCGSSVAWALSAVLLGLASTSAAAHALSADEETFDLGYIDESNASAIHHSFVIRNRSNHPIHVAGVDHTCSCTTAVVSASEIPPLGFIRLDITIDWTGRHGRQMANITVRTENPDALTYFTVAGVIDTGFAVSPPFLEFGQLSATDTVRRLVLVAQTRDDTPPPAFEAVASTAAITATLKTNGPFDRVGKCFEISISAKKLPAGDGEASVVFAALGSARKPIILPITYTRIPDIVPIPGALRFDRSAEETRSISFHLNGECADPEFEIEPEDARAGFLLGKPRPFLDNRESIISLDVRSVCPADGVLAGRLVARIAGREVASVSLARF